MKFLQFAPGSTQSAIGKSAGLLTQGLHEAGHEVVVVRTDGGPLLEESARNFGCETLRWDDRSAVRSALKAADLALYQIGDYFPFHEGALHWLERHPGAVILHDFYVGSLFRGWARTRRARADRILTRWYGESVARSFFKPGPGSAVDRTWTTAPMTEWIASQAHGVLTHSTWGCDRVLAACPGPVVVAPLAYPFEPLAPVDTPLPVESVVAERRRFRVLTVGHVNQNKRAESIIRAIGRSKNLRTRATYELAGPIEPGPARRLAALARECRVDLLVSGRLSDEALHEAIRGADVISCLRWPCLEAASASLVEAMLAGKPVVVTDAGSYRDLPTSVVAKVRHETEIDDLQTVLTDLLANPEARRRMGEQAREWAQEHFELTAYVEAAVDLAHAVLEARSAQMTAAVLAKDLASWTRSVDPALLSPVVSGLAMFGEGSSGGTADPNVLRLESRAGSGAA